MLESYSNGLFIAEAGMLFDLPLCSDVELLISGSEEKTPSPTVVSSATSLTRSELMILKVTKIRATEKNNEED